MLLKHTLPMQTLGEVIALYLLHSLMKSGRLSPPLLPIRCLIVIQEECYTRSCNYRLAVTHLLLVALLRQTFAHVSVLNH